VNPALLRLLVSNGGMVAREAALAHVEHDVLDRAVRSGRLLCPYPRVYLDPELGDDRMALTRAAVLYAGGRAAVSHLSALGLWRLPVPDDGPVHLMTAPSSHLRGAPGLIVHRRAALGLAPPEVLVRGELPVIRLERSIVDSWPLLSGDAKRAPVIFAVGGRMTTVGRVRDALGAAPRLGGRRYLVHLLDLLELGCRSELELWGYANVFRGLGLRWQVPFPLGRRTVHLDVFDEAGRVNFELDGRKYHGSVQDRERDLRRDAALAACGIMVVRFTHERLVREPEAVREQTLEIMAARRAQLAA